eukprot:4706618-Pyramimonas_sp.AAC.1
MAARTPCASCAAPKTWCATVSMEFLTSCASRAAYLCAGSAAAYSRRRELCGKESRGRPSPTTSSGSFRLSGRSTDLGGSRWPQPHRCGRL